MRAHALLTLQFCRLGPVEAIPKAQRTPQSKNSYSGNVQAWLPEVFLNVGGVHASHKPPSGPVYPTLHLQSCSSTLDAGALEFGGHFRHKEWLLALYVFMPHAVHADIDVAAVDGEYLPGGQSEHVVTDVAPMDSEYLPGGHACLSADPLGQ